MSSDKPRLWAFESSPFAGKARAAFAEKGVDFELIEIHPVKRPGRLRELNPLNRVPVLELPDAAIRESSIICEWLEETYPEPPLWPASPGARAAARGWAKYIDDTLTANFFLGMRKLAFGPDEGDPPDITDRLHRRMERHWATIEDVLEASDGPWVCGEQFTYADVGAMPLAVRLPQWKPELVPDTPRLTAWLNALRERPSAAAVEQRGEQRLSA
ncbi:MAG: glutathione S-transferase family protein [Solirubrobacteraceae bacterium]